MHFGAGGVPIHWALRFLDAHVSTVDGIPAAEAADGEDEGHEDSESTQGDAHWDVVRSGRLGLEGWKGRGEAVGDRPKISHLDVCVKKGNFKFRFLLFLMELHNKI